jgi:PAS domain S-box-containing protein
VIPGPKEHLAQQVIITVSKILSRDLSHEEAFTEMLKSMCEQLGWQTASFWRLNEVTQQLRCETSYCVHPCPKFNEMTLDMLLRRGEGLPGRVWEASTPIWIRDVVQEPNFPRAEQAQEDGLHAAFAFPVSVGGKFIGVFEFFSRTIVEPDTELVNAFGVVGTEVGQFFERRRVELELAESERRFREFASVVDEVFFMSAPRLTEHFYVSPAFDKLWGFPVSEVFANPQSWYDAVVPEHKERVKDYVALLQGETMPDKAEIEYAIRKPDGTTAWLSARCFRIDQHDGTWHICGTVRDITERKQAEQRIGEFYSTVSHELRTPLTSIKGSLILLERQKAGDLSERATDLVSLARKECDRLIRLINDMLDIKTLEAGKLQLVREPLKPRDLVGETLAVQKNMATEKHIQLLAQVETSRSVSADRDRILQVLTNLLSNAVKFSPAHSQVTVRVHDVDSAVEFSVIDHGPGIAPEHQAKLFEVFQQIPPASGESAQGTGLGLAISKGIIDQHGGTIGVSSDKGAGARFWFRLPLT